MQRRNHVCVQRQVTTRRSLRYVCVLRAQLSIRSDTRSTFQSKFEPTDTRVTFISQPCSSSSSRGQWLNWTSDPTLTLTTNKCHHDSTQKTSFGIKGWSSTSSRQSSSDPGLKPSKRRTSKRVAIWCLEIVRRTTWSTCLKRLQYHAVMKHLYKSQKRHLPGLAKTRSSNKQFRNLLLPNSHK